MPQAKHDDQPIEKITTGASYESKTTAESRAKTAAAVKETVAKSAKDAVKKDKASGKKP